MTDRGQIVTAVIQPVGQVVFSTGQDVAASGQTVCPVHCVTIGARPHCVATAGHAVNACGQTVAVPMPSAHIVATVSVLHAVGNSGHRLLVRGHLVVSSGQTVGVLVPSLQIVLELASHAVSVAGQ